MTETKVRNTGKTLRDHLSKAKEQNLSNKDARVAWQKDSRARNSNFPIESCNGKKTRALAGKK